MLTFISKGADIGEMVLRARSDENAFTELVKAQSKHIRFAAYKTVGRFITESDDEWSTALVAFHEAVQKYDPAKGGFMNFADLVIKRRLTDEMRKTARRVEEVPFGDDHCEMAVYEVPVTSDLHCEIEAFKQQMAPYNISFSDLVSASPKAEKTRRSCAAAIRCITSDPVLADKMRKTRTLPAKEIRISAGVPPKILERHRKYIIAASEIILSDLPCMQQFLKTVREEGEHESSSNGI